MLNKTYNMILAVLIIYLLNMVFVIICIFELVFLEMF